MLELLPQLLANGLIAGAIYALIAAGFSLVYSTNRFIHFAHGAVVTASAYFLFALVEAGIGLLFSFIAMLAFAALIGFVMNRFFYRPLREKKSSAAVLLIASIGLMIVVENLVLAAFGPTIRSFSFITVQEGMNIAGAYITPLQVFILAAAALLLLGLHLLMQKTMLGKKMRAVADHPELSSIQGISHERIYTYTFVLGSIIGGIGGALVSFESNLFHTMGTQLMVKAFAGSVMGGISSVPGAVIGSLLLGLLENLGILFLPSAWKDAIAFSLLFIFILLRPQGLFGIDKGVRI